MLTVEQLAEIKARAERHILDKPWPDETHPDLLDLAQLVGTDVPSLLAEVKRLRAENERLIKGISHAHHALGRGWTVSPRATLAELLRGERPC